jgi:hypothetical protein
MVVKNYGRAKMFNKMNLGYGVVQLFLWQKDAKAGPTGIEPATPGLKVRCSSLTELRAHNLLLIGKLIRGSLAFRFSMTLKIGNN